MIEPTFSFIMPTFNRVYSIKLAIDSVLKQSYTNFELIIVDDNSTDGTKEFIKETYKKELESKKIIYHYSDEKIGVSKARNIALSLAKNDWIAYVDSDNEIFEDFLITYADLIKKHKKKKTFYAGLRYKNSQKVLLKKFNFRKLLRGNLIDLGVFVHNKSLYETLNGFDENLKRLVDWDLIIKYTEKCPPAKSDNIVMLYDDSLDESRISVKEDAELAYDIIRSKYEDKGGFFYKEKIDNKRNLYFFGVKIWTYTKK